MPLRPQVRSPDIITPTHSGCRQLPPPPAPPRLLPAHWHCPTLLSTPAAADDKSSIKSEELLALDGQLGGALADIVSLYEFKGKAVSAWR